MPLALLLALATAAPTYGLTGVVRSEKGDAPVAGALVVLQCTCFAGTREVETGADGRYRFRGLPAGTHTIMVLRGDVAVSKVVTLGPRR